jgi:hypothetical protein
LSPHDIIQQPAISTTDRRWAGFKQTKKAHLTGAKRRLRMELRLKVLSLTATPISINRCVRWFSAGIAAVTDPFVSFGSFKEITVY